MEFRIATTGFRDSLLTRRDGELRVGERIGIPVFADLERAIGRHPGEYVLLGIPEDIGVRANLGVGGAHTAWEPALKAFLNTQSNRQVDGNEVLLLGAFDFVEALQQSLSAPAGVLRELVAQIDDVVAPVIQTITAAGKIPIVIGGGHNNAFPILKGCSGALGQMLNCINLDAHSDFRRVEGRHSGNGFRYAMEGGYLNHYALPWLHEAYNSAAVVADLESNPRILLQFAEGSGSLGDAISGAMHFVNGAPCGIELDLDCIAGVLSSAATPAGITTAEARTYVRRCATETACAYLHLTEGATELRDGRKDPLTAKLISYLIRDFIAARKAPGRF